MKIKKCDLIFCASSKRRISLFTSSILSGLFNHFSIGLQFLRVISSNKSRFSLNQSYAELRITFKQHHLQSRKIFLQLCFKITNLRRKIRTISLRSNIRVSVRPYSHYEENAKKFRERFPNIMLSSIESYFFLTFIKKDYSQKQ